MNEQRRNFIDLVDRFQEVIACSEERGKRTLEHNTNVGGAADSAHVYGLAIDLILDSAVSVETALFRAKQLGFSGIEWDVRNRHLHLDLHPSHRHWWVRIDSSGVVTNLSPSATEL